MKVRLFARLRDLAGRDTLDIELPPDATVGDVRRALADQHPALRGLLERCVIAVNEDFADDTMRVPADAEVAILPPVSGGSWNGQPCRRAANTEGGDERSQSCRTRAGLGK
jgi:molybdopterin converting factor subunit 1